MPTFVLEPLCAGADQMGLDRAAKLRQLNDSFRRMPVGGQIFITPGVTSLSPAEQCRLCLAVRDFDAFTPENDPYGEHDFGAIEQGGTSYYWKIDYYDLELAFGSDDPTDSAVTIRVLTIMRADEY